MPYIASQKKELAPKYSEEVKEGKDEDEAKGEELRDEDVQMLHEKTVSNIKVDKGGEPEVSLSALNVLYGKEEHGGDPRPPPVEVKADSSDEDSKSPSTAFNIRDVQLLAPGEDHRKLKGWKKKRQQKTRATAAGTGREKIRSSMQQNIN